MADFNLDRFVQAQDRVWPNVEGELKAGAKRSHWIWFVFPQIAGLGMSEMSRAYAISGLEEARAYLQHPVLGARFRESTGWVLAARGQTAGQIFGALDAQKFRSCMTLFARATDEALFTEALGIFFAGMLDEATLALL